jgi:hypothetical protein
MRKRLWAPIAIMVACMHPLPLPMTLLVARAMSYYQGIASTATLSSFAPLLLGAVVLSMSPKGREWMSKGVATWHWQIALTGAWSRGHVVVDLCCLNVTDCSSRDTNNAGARLPTMH